MLAGAIVVVEVALDPGLAVVAVVPPAAVAWPVELPQLAASIAATTAALPRTARAVLFECVVILLPHPLCARRPTGRSVGRIHLLYGRRQGASSATIAQVIGLSALIPMPDGYADRGQAGQLA